MTSKILYIEDNPQNMRLVRKMLKIGGHEMIEAKDGETGLALAFSEEPDLILVDINLPDIDGTEITRRLKSSKLAHIPIIALTANAMVGDKERYTNAGCDGYLAKPITKNELLNTVAHFLALRVEIAQAS